VSFNSRQIQVRTEVWRPDVARLPELTTGRCDDQWNFCVVCVSTPIRVKEDLSWVLAKVCCIWLLGIPIPVIILLAIFGHH
jgi:hypothetical protein